MLPVATIGAAGMLHAPLHVSRTTAPSMMDVADLRALAKSQNPVLGFWDPLNIAGQDFFPDRQDTGNEGTIAWFRHAEMKHGRVAMAGFVGYIVHENGNFQGAEGLSAPDVWDQCPTDLKLGTILSVGVLEWLTESKQPHYMNVQGGGEPGNLRAPRGNSSPERARKLNIEINNGRLAMIGLFGFIAESNVPGSVPALTGKIKPYTGAEIMAPFGASDDLPFVKQMLGFASEFEIWGGVSNSVKAVAPAVAEKAAAVVEVAADAAAAL